MQFSLENANNETRHKQFVVVKSNVRYKNEDISS